MTDAFDALKNKIYSLATGDKTQEKVTATSGSAPVAAAPVATQEKTSTSTALNGDVPAEALSQLSQLLSSAAKNNSSVAKKLVTKVHESN